MVAAVSEVGDPVVRAALRPASDSVGLGGDPATFLRHGASQPGCELLRPLAAAWEVGAGRGAGLADSVAAALARLEDTSAELRGLMNDTSGAGAEAFLNHTLTNDIRKLTPGLGQYTLLCNERGGVIDDLYAYQLSSGVYLLIINASRIAADVAWLQARAAEFPAACWC